MSTETPARATSHAAHVEGARIMQICNACRYCEGYCAVFPAMERRLEFAAGDLDYLANLCHGCGECYYACQFAPPHEFSINIPVTFAEIRRESYARYAWPRAFGRAYEANGPAVAAVLVVALVAMFALASRLFGSAGFFGYDRGDGDFYALMPHSVMAGLFSAVGLFVLVAFVVGFARFWRDAGESAAELTRPQALGEALRDAFSLTYLTSRGAGCTYPTEKHSGGRRHAHHLTFYGFLACFAATIAGTIEHYVFGRVAPYPIASVPVLLGIAGGIGLVVGPAVLLALKARQDPATRAAATRGMDVAFVWLLILTSATGLALLAFRGTSALGFWLAVHLALVMALFLTMPYGKFVHGLYRFGALLRYAVERRRPGLAIGGD